MKRVILLISIFTLSLVSVLVFNNHDNSADAVLYPISSIDTSEITDESYEFVFTVSPNTFSELYIDFTDTPNTIFFDSEEIDTSKTYKKEISFPSEMSEYSFVLSTSTGNSIADSVSQIRLYGSIPSIDVLSVELVDEDPLYTAESAMYDYLHINFDIQNTMISENMINLEFPEGVVPAETASFYYNNEYIYEDNNLLISDILIYEEGLYIPVTYETITENPIVLSGSYTSSLGLETGGFTTTNIYNDGINISFEREYTNYSYTLGSTSLDQEVTLLDGDTYNIQYIDTTTIASVDDPYVPTFDLSDYYTLSNEDNIYYSNFQFDADSDFTIQIPYKQSGEFDDFQLYLTERNSYNETGNTLDVYADSELSDFTYYKEDDIRGTGSEYQYNLSNLGFDSLGIDFTKDGFSYNYSDSNNIDGTFGNSLTGYSLDTELDDNIYFYELSYDYENKTLSIGINTIDLHEDLDYEVVDTVDKLIYNRNNNELVSIIKPVVIDLSEYEFTPTSFLMYMPDSVDDRLYLPIIDGTRYFSNLTFENSPVYYDLGANSDEMPINKMVIDSAVPVVYNYINGELQNTQLLDFSTGIDNILRSTYIEKFGEVEYSQDNLFSAIYHFNLQTKQTIDDQIVYQTASFPLYMGMLPDYAIELEVESPVLYPVGVYIPEDDYAGFSANAFLYSYNGSSYDLIEDISTYTEVYDFSNLNYNVKGNYTVYYRCSYPNPVTGELMFKTISQTVKVDDPTMDYGDLPESYGDAGSVGEASKTFQIGYNLDANNQSYIDREFYPYYNEFANGDDLYGIDDELGYLNMSPEDFTGINYQIDSIRFEIPYIASSASQICMWLDLNGSGDFSTDEGQCAKGVPIKHGNFGTVAYTYDLTQAHNSIEPNTKVGMRIRISANAYLDESGYNVVDESAVGEVEDYMVDIYGPRNDAEICIDTAVKSPSFVMTDLDTKSGDVVMTADIPSSYAPGYVYQNATVTISSNGTLDFDAKRGDSAIISVTAPRNGVTTLDVVVRDQYGDPIYAPFTTGFWGIDNGAYVKNTTPTFKGSYADEYLQLSGDTIGSYTLDTSNDTVVGGQFIYTVLPEATANPSTYLWMIPSLYYTSDFSFESNADQFYFTMGYNSAALTLPIEDCIENFGANAYLTVQGDKLTDANLYTHYPFDYESENIAIPYYDNLESFSHVFEIPDGSSFVDGDNQVEVYRRPFNSNYSSGGEWTLVDSDMYTQSMYTPNQEQIDNGISGISLVTFNNPVENGTYGYEYKFIYHMQLNSEYTYRVNDDGTKELKTGEEVTFNTYLYYDKHDGFSLNVYDNIHLLDGFDYAGDEAYYLNPVVVTVREPFNMLVNTIMDDDIIYVNTDGTQNYYTLTYNNCSTCGGVTSKTYLPQGENEIEMPIPDISSLSLSSSDSIDQYEDMTLSIYDNDLLALEIPIYRWYPADLYFEVASLADLEDFNDNLNPIEQQHYIRMGYASYLETYYASEKLNINSLGHDVSVTDGQLQINPGLSITVNNGWPSELWDFSDTINMKIFSDNDKYIDLTDERLNVYLPLELIDSTLMVPLKEFDSDTYGLIEYAFSETSSVDNSIITYQADLDDKYVIEQYSGRIYNSEEATDCQVSNTCISNEKFYPETSDDTLIASGHNDYLDTDLVISENLDSVMLLNNDPSLLNKTYDYIVTIKNLGLNDSEVKINLSFDYESLMVSYKQEDAMQYIYKTKVSEDEKQCIENDTCDSDYELLFEGVISSTAKVKNQINGDINKLSNTYKNSLWLGEYYY